MSPFDPEKFEEKYVHYLAELNKAYRNAFDYMNDHHDSGLVHAIDQQILDASEPFYEGDGVFRIELPDAPKELIKGVDEDDERFDDVLSEYVERIEFELQSVFDFDTNE